MKQLKRPFYTRLDTRDSYKIPAEEQTLVDVIVDRQDAISIVAELATALSKSRTQQEFNFKLCGRSWLIGSSE